MAAISYPLQLLNVAIASLYSVNLSAVKRWESVMIKYTPKLILTILDCRSNNEKDQNAFLINKEQTDTPVTIST